MRVDSSSPQRINDAHTAPLSTPAKTTRPLSLIQRFVQWIKSFFPSRHPVLPQIAHQAQTAAIAHPLVEKPIHDRSPQVVPSQPEASRILAATTLAKANDASVEDAINLMEARAKQGVQTEKATESSTELATESITDSTTEMATDAIIESDKPTDTASPGISETPAFASAALPETTETIETSVSSAAVEAKRVFPPSTLAPEESAAQTTVQSEQAATTAPSDERWHDGFTTSDHNAVSHFIDGMRHQWSASTPSELPQASASDNYVGGIKAFLGSKEAAFAPATIAPPITSTDPLISEHLAHMRSSAPKDPVYDAQWAGQTGFPSKQPISPKASDKALVSAFLANVAHSIGKGTIRYQPDMEGSLKNIRTRLGNTTEAQERADAMERLAQTLTPRQLAPVGRNATFSIAKSQPGDGNALRTLSEYLLPPDEDIQHSMQIAMANAPDDFIPLGDHAIAAQFADQLATSSIDLHVESPATGLLNRARALVSGRQTQVKTLNDIPILYAACFENETMMSEVTRHLQPDSVNNVVMARFGTGNGQMMIDGTQIELARTAPTFRYTVKSSERIIDHQGIDVVDVTIEATWDIAAFTGASPERHTPLGNAQSTFTAVVNFPIVPQSDLDDNFFASQGAVTVTARTAIGNVIHFDEHGKRA